jgi:DNA-binding Lrp family transcriptional regulator
MAVGGSGGAREGALKKPKHSRRGQVAEQAFVLMKVKSGSSKAVEDALGDLTGVKLAHTVMGPYDVVVFVEGPNIDGLREMIMKKIQSIPGVRHTTTLLVI